MIRRLPYNGKCACSAAMSGIINSQTLEVDMRSGRAVGIPFLTLGITFIALGASGQRAFLGIGVVFLVLGTIFLARQRPGGGSE